ncbi:MAG TPA: hypothetical protein VFF69_14565 [Phycisphaerales bacterium]|nr:hypothetical protein [Phycisphaerales bacterium]
MPPTEEMIDRAAQCMGETRLVRFAADRTSVQAGETVTISWKVEMPGACRLSVRLNHAQVAREGSMTIRPVRGVSYRLDVAGAGLTKSLGIVNVSVDASSCVQREIPEDLVRPEVLASVAASLAEYNADPENKDHKVSTRREPTVEIEPDGIVLRLRLKLAINNFFDPDIDVDARIDVGMSPEGKVLAFYRSFAVDVDWPWWVTGITLGISKIVEEFVDGAIESVMKSRIVDDLRSGLQSRLDDLGQTIGSLDTAQDAILVTVCGSGGGDSKPAFGHVSRFIGHDLVLTRR